MKRMRYSILRRLTLIVYFLMTVLFCFYLFKLGGDEMKKAEKYTSSEKRYVKALLHVRETLNELDELYFSLTREPDIKKIRVFSGKVDFFRLNISELVELERGRPLRAFMPRPQLKERANALYSASKILETDFQERNIDSTYLVNSDMVEIADTLRAIHSDVQGRLNVELDHVENWQNQSLFFFDKLEMSLVYFFALTTFFTFAAFLISGHALRRYLGFLSRGAGEISSGNLDYRFNDTTSDLIGDVMRDFDRMAERVSIQNANLANINFELRRKADELVEANLHKDRFLANMSHELRTPLNSIIGFSELIATRSAKLESDKTEEFANRILSAAEHLLSLITDLLEIAKVDAGVLEVEKETFDLATLCGEVVEMMRPIADGKRLELIYDYFTETLLIDADKRLMRQLLINLLNNALKFTHEGRVKLELSVSENKTIISVSDTGIGISRKDCELIFKDFYRVERGLTSKYEGVGLGLTLSKRIVELHGGVIEVDSEFGKGTVFTVAL